MLLNKKKEPLGIALLSGGGIDSTLCAHLLVEEGFLPRAIHIDYGQPARHLEWEAVKKMAMSLGIRCEQINISWNFQNKNGETPGRNSAFIFLAMMHTLPSERGICIGIHAGTSFRDCSKDFYEYTCRAVAEQTDSSIRLMAPLLELNKNEIMMLAKLKGISLHETYSCQKGVPGGCGMCHSCLDRKALGC